MLVIWKALAQNLLLSVATKYLHAHKYCEWAYALLTVLFDELVIEYT